ncbi:LysR family transcriptional regulator [Nonomuraea insulae]|uniref:LysR family transcriptional regulator n=1 Tax=Nonomuraea insulae TaxID=1616787 RepID=A0ABW1DES6_9ACTN
MLNPSHLRTLAEVIETGSFAEAARRLGYTSSAVSQQMAALERAVKAQLFEREAHGIQPSATAQFIAARGADLLVAIEDLQEEIASLVAGRVGALRLGSFPTANARVVPPVIASLVHAHHGVEVQLDEGEPARILELLADGGVDVGVVYAYDLVPMTWPDGLTPVNLLVEDLVLLLPRHYRIPGPIEDLGVLRSEKWISSQADSAGSTCLARLCAARGFEPRIAFRSNDYDVVRGLVAAGVGVAVVPALAHTPDPAIRAQRLPASPHTHRHVLALHRAANSNPLLGEALKALRESCGQVQEEIREEI